MSERGGARTLRVVLWAALLWTGIGLFFASQIYLMRPDVPWFIPLLIWMPHWYAWGLITPGVLWADRRLAAGRSLAARVAWHVPLGIGSTSLLIAVLFLLLPTRATLVQFFLQTIYWDLVVYAVIAGVAIARDLAAQARLREAEAHQLALHRIALERRLTEAGLHSLRAQVHPHFLFNALSTISAFTASEPGTARRLMGQLGDLLRASLRHASRPLVSLGEELTFLDDYLAIELARLEGRLTVAVHADDRLLDEPVPSFLLQPLVENAIRHGIGPRMAGGHIDVTVERDGPVLRLRVRDNGVGLAPDWQFERNAGMGLQNLSTRLEHVYGRTALLRIASTAEGGVEVRVDLPFQATLSAPSTAAAHAAASEA